MSRIVRVGFLGLALLSLGSCTKDLAQPVTPSLPSYWRSLGLAGPYLTALLQVGDSLFVADRTAGVFLLSPALRPGDWMDLGLDLPDLAPGPRGVLTLASHDGTLLAGLDLPLGDARPRLQRLEPPTWVDAGFAPQSRVPGLLSTPSGWLGIDASAPFLSSDGGVSWRRPSDQPVEVAEQGGLFPAQDGTFWGGATDSGEPRLVWSATGESWIALPTPELPGKVAVIHWAAGTRTRYVLAADLDIFLTEDGGLSFTQVLEITRLPGQIFMNPQDDHEMLIVGDGIYHSTNGGQNWAVYQPPFGVFLGPSQMNWGERLLPVLITDGFNAAVFLFDLTEAIRVFTSKP